MIQCVDYFYEYYISPPLSCSWLTLEPSESHFAHGLISVQTIKYIIIVSMSVALSVELCPHVTGTKAYYALTQIADINNSYIKRKQILWEERHMAAIM